MIKRQKEFIKYLEECRKSGKYKSIDNLLAQEIEMAQDEEALVEEYFEGQIS